MEFEPIHEMVRRSAERFGDRVAVESGDQRVTYSQLEAKAEAIATSLRRAGAEAGAPVAVLATRTADVIAAMLGCLKAGCAFMPLDLHFPLATLPTLVEAVPARWWLAGAEQVEILAELRGQHAIDAVVIPMDGGWPAQGEGGEPATALDPDALCYVYFTSGSTGRPKGIAGRLKAVDHFVRWEVDTFGIDEGARVSQLTSPAFDAFLRDAFVPLAAGGTVCVPPTRDVVLDGARLVEWIDREGLTLVHCTPSLFRSILGQDLASTRFPALRHVLLAGESLMPSDVKRWHSVFADRIQLVNLYGPSETTMIKLFYPVRPTDGDARFIPIGGPIAGARAIVVDEKGQPCPPGKLGEILIRTPYRTLGYINRPDLTQEVFVQNPFSDQPEDIVYRTGDLGRAREDGNLEFLGRRDQQVKVRGVRIELGPIEDLLRSHEAVAEAVVVDRTDTQGNKYLCAYVVLRQELDMARLQDLLRTRLPEAMMPSLFMALDALPRTLSGKVDRRALPDPGAAERLGREYVAPRTPAEETLARIFGELLGQLRIGVHDSFFELGGHSLLATLLLSRIRSSFGVELPLREIFRASTVEGLALTVARLRMEQEDAADMAALLGEIEELVD